MDNQKYVDFLLRINTLSASQLRHLGLRVSQQLGLDDINHAVEKRLENISHCAHCGSENIVRWGMNRGLQRFRCKCCGKTFNELTGTPLARMRKLEQLGLYAQSMLDGDTLRQASAKCKIALSTSFQWRHKLLAMPASRQPAKLGGIVEVDETFFRESFKGKRTILHRKPRKHGRFSRKDAKLQIPVLIALDRNEHEADFVLAADTKAQVHPCLKGLIRPDAVLCTDGSQLYPQFAEEEGLCHKRILSINQARTTGDGAFHIQTLNNYVSRLRGWLVRFRGVGTAYLGNYLAWWRNIAFEELLSRRAWLHAALKT